MRRIGIMFLIFMILVGCAGGASEIYGCSHYKEVCIRLMVEEPIKYGEPNTINIDVTSTQDVTNLSVYLDAFPPILIEDNSNWVEGVISWEIDIEANQTQIFTRRILLPEVEGFYKIISSAYTNQLNVSNSFVIHQLQNGSMIYYANTPIPYTQQPLPNTSPELLETLHAIPTPTHYPTLIPYPMITSTPISPAYPPPASPTSVWDAPGENPYP